MKFAFVALVGLASLLGVDARAASLCNCCGNDTQPVCSDACAPVKTLPGQCVATVDFNSEAIIGPDQNPLYDIPLQTVWLGSPNNQQVEEYRRLLEKARRAAEKDRRMALSDRRNRKIDAATADRAARRYDEALVNYYLGVQAYRMARE